MQQCYRKWQDCLHDTKTVKARIMEDSGSHIVIGCLLMDVRKNSAVV
jgi:hypothetical protein